MAFKSLFTFTVKCRNNQHSDNETSGVQTQAVLVLFSKLIQLLDNYLNNSLSY